jgi:hypothetical protein
MNPKNSRSALAALLFAGGLWAYKNRDKVKGWINSQSSQLGNQPRTLPSGDQPFTGATRRFDEEFKPGDFSSDTQTPES